MKNNNIILVGFMGVGKGTLARELTKALDMMVIDTDDLIESMENRKVKEIFATEGEDYFRGLENRVGTWVSKNVTNTIVSTGGGFPMFVKDLEKMGTVVLLDSSFNGIYQRILNSPNAEKKLKKRPLFKDTEKAKELYEKRLKTYRKRADLIISVENRDLKDVVKDFKKEFK
ncbi:MAG: AAA family ATPase [Campylobacterales bacterium]|nr:AAA family ATPase [Campylobacterales bacterium]